MREDTIISVTKRLLNLEPNSFEISTGLIVEYNHKLIFAIQNPNRWRRSGNLIEAGLVGIGGKLEENETIIE